MSTSSDEENHSSCTFSEVTGLILAGGKSSRYGANKALVEVYGTLLIERVVRVMKAVFEEVILVTNTPEDYSFLDLPMVEDLIRGLGPIGGIYTGLATISTDAGFFVACDMPFLNAGLLRHMVKSRKGFDAVVPRMMGWMFEPLHALYTKNCLSVIKSVIDEHEYQLARCFQKIRVRYMDEEELRSFDPELWSLFNINKPQDLPSTPPRASSMKDRLPSGGEGRGEGGME